MPPKLAGSIGMPTVQLLCHESCNIRYSRQQRYLGVTESREPLQNGWQPKSYPITPTHREEIAQSQEDHVTIVQSSPNAVGMKALLGLFLLL